MGRSIPSEENSVFSLMERLLVKNKVHINPHVLKRLLQWVAAEVPGVNTVTIFTVLIGDGAAVRLWECAAQGNQAVAELLPTRRTLFEIITRQNNECGQAVNTEDEDTEGEDAYFERRQQDLYAGSLDCDNLLDPDTVNPKRDPGLCPPLAGDDPWVKVRQEALAQGYMDMARKIVAPVIYAPGRQARWEGLHLSVTEE